MTKRTLFKLNTPSPEKIKELIRSHEEELASMPEEDFEEFYHESYCWVRFDEDFINREPWSYEKHNAEYSKLFDNLPRKKECPWNG